MKKLTASPLVRTGNQWLSRLVMRCTEPCFNVCVMYVCVCVCVCVYASVYFSSLLTTRGPFISLSGLVMFSVDHPKCHTSRPKHHSYTCWPIWLHFVTSLEWRWATYSHYMHIGWAYICIPCVHDRNTCVYTLYIAYSIKWTVTL